MELVVGAGFSYVYAVYQTFKKFRYYYVHLIMYPCDTGRLDGTEAATLKN